MNLPQSVDGTACLHAVRSAIRLGDMGGVSVDIGGALALAQANGASTDIAGPLIAACAEGLMRGVSDKRGESE